MKPELISFKLCPFVQRSVITLLEKGIDFDIRYIELDDPPDWFLAISPTGKVPVLRCGDEVLFESAVINEYLDEVNPPSLHPAEPLRKAKNRAWIEFSSELIMLLHGIMTSTDENTFQQKQQQLRDALARVEGQMGAGPFFNGTAFSLLDSAYAPLLMRLDLILQHTQLDLLQGLPALQAWSRTLLARQSVQDSVVADFPQLLDNMILKAGGQLSASL